MSRRILPYGDRTLLAEVDGLEEAMGLYSALTAVVPDGVVDVIPAARTVTVSFDPARIPLERVRTWLTAAGTAAPAAVSGQPVTIEVDYSGEDLAEVAALLGITTEEVVERHTSSLWRVAFCGFTPGFAYLVTDHDRLSVPRRTSPRTAVPAGSVGLAGEFSGIYPRSSPGGWQLIGRTDAVLWDAASATPALLVPGSAVRFRRAS